MKPRCYCCGAAVGAQFVLVSYEEHPDRVFVMTLEHARRCSDMTPFLLRVACVEGRAMPLDTPVSED